MIRVINDHVVLAPHDPSVTPAGIIIPDAHQDTKANEGELIRNSNQYAKARVVATYGTRRTKKGATILCDLEVGDWTIYRRSEATSIDERDPETGDELVIVHEESCIMIVDPDVDLERAVTAEGGAA